MTASRLLSGYASHWVALPFVRYYANIPSNELVCCVQRTVETRFNDTPLRVCPGDNPNQVYHEYHLERENLRLKQELSSFGVV